MVPVVPSVALTRIPRQLELALKFVETDERLLTVVRLGDSRVLEGNSIDGVVRTASDAANGQTVTTRAVTAAEGDVLAR